MSQEDANRRHPRDLQGLLRFAMEATRAEDAPHPSVFQEMDPERRRFLEEAIRSLTIDVVEQIQKAMKILIEGQASAQEQKEALDTVIDFIENIDTANDFYKIGGFCILLPGLESPYAEVRQGTAELIGELAQNNPFCQEHLLELNVLPKLIELLTDEANVANHALHAISCIIRHNEACLRGFLEIGGAECLVGVLESGHEKLLIKTAFLLSTLCVEDSKLREDVIKFGAVERLIRHIAPRTEYDPLLETALSALYVLTESETAITQCQDSRFNLCYTLEDVIKVSGNNDVFQECIGYAEGLIKRCFTPTSPEETDR
ncbi:hsp70-binding protein 1 [Culicoides brevitarsis]|uniref:hsp70-binding protein 1 n=1 Tax=Culicoides brevitarsis TaxID=469753 RepID=UPI00307BEE1B